MTHNILKEHEEVNYKLNLFQEKKNFNWKILKEISTCHLRLPNNLLKKINKKYLTLSDIKSITTYQEGMIHFELSGNMLCSLLNDDFRFSINKESSGWNFESKRPFSYVSFDNVDRENVVRCFWHLHPWNSMNLIDNQGRRLPNFFSIEDIDLVFTYPQHLFIIFNTESEFQSELIYPCIYFLMFDPNLINFITNPTDLQRIITGYSRVLVPFIYEKMKNKDNQIDWENIKATFLSLGIKFEYMFNYNKKHFFEKVNTVTNGKIDLTNCKKHSK